jgi:diaminopimelate epimerase
MTTTFVKMHGAGNDFIVFDGRSLGFRLSAAGVHALCDRRRGVGADGILVVTVTAPDRLTVFYVNRDGGEAFCGNGTRCAVRFARTHAGLAPNARAVTAAGELRVRDLVSRLEVEMPAPVLDPSPITLSVFDPALQDGWRVRVGVPHLVVPVPSTETIDVEGLGARLRGASILGPEGANVDFVDVRSEDRLRVRTYERGVEGETLACGTGAVAVAAWHARTAVTYTRAVETKSGDTLEVRLDGEGTWLAGPAIESYRGEIDLGRWTGA